jgi:hypothetical protein
MKGTPVAHLDFLRSPFREVECSVSRNERDNDSPNLGFKGAAALGREPLSYTKINPEDSQGINGRCGWLYFTTPEGVTTPRVSAAFTKLDVSETSKRQHILFEFSANNDRVVEILKVVRNFEKAAVSIYMYIIEPPPTIFAAKFHVRVFSNCSLTNVKSSDTEHTWNLSAALDETKDEATD